MTFMKNIKILHAYLLPLRRRRLVAYTVPNWFIFVAIFVFLNVFFWSILNDIHHTSAA